MKQINYFIYFGIRNCLCLLFFVAHASAQLRTVIDDAEDPRGAPELTICSQNLMIFGSSAGPVANTGKLLGSAQSRVPLLVDRMVKARCDVIAVQEVSGKDEYVAKDNLMVLAKELQEKTGRKFELRVGPSNDETLHNGFLVAIDRAAIQNLASYSKVELPKLIPQQKPRFFNRAPLEVQLLVKGKGEAAPKTVSIVNFHFKSRAGAGDPTALQWETYRMEMAEGLRRAITKRHAQSFQNAQTLLVVLGDRNSHFDTASARLLEGSLSIDNFQKDGLCRLSKSGVPLCKEIDQKEPKLFSVLTTNPLTQNQPGTFLFKKTFYWLDDILLPSESLTAAWNDYASEGEYASGVIREPLKASDHALIYVSLNW